MRNFFLAVFLLGLTSTAFAGGYRVSLQGVRQASIGLTSVMYAHDASVQFFNPAALAFVDSKFSVAVGGFGIDNKVKWQNPGTLESAKTDNPWGTPIYAAVSYRPIKDVTVGVSLTTPFGSTIKWGEEWAGRNLITHIKFKTFFIQPTAAFKFTDWFSAGVGLVYAQGDITLERMAAVSGNEVMMKLEDNSVHGWGFNVGAFFRPAEKWNIGLAYRAPIDMTAGDGKAHFFDVPTALSGNMPFSANKFRASLPAVSEFLAGFSYQATPKLLLAAEVSVNGWQRYDELNIHLENTDTGEEVVSSQRKGFKNRAIWKIGAEYQLMDMLALRLGYYFDEFVTPSENWSPETPDVTRNSITGGVGVNFGDFNVDASASVVLGRERTFYNTQTDFGGQVKVNALVLGLGLSYNLN